MVRYARKSATILIKCKPMALGKSGFGLLWIKKAPPKRGRSGWVEARSTYFRNTREAGIAAATKGNESFTACSPTGKEIGAAGAAPVPYVRPAEVPVVAGSAACATATGELHLGHDLRREGIVVCQ
jgi:hypothetical protein